MMLGKRYLRVTNLMFIVLLAIQFLPDKISKTPGPHMSSGSRSERRCLC